MLNALETQLLQDAAQRLHHIGIRYVGALAEVGRGREVGLLPAKDPGVHEMRDLIDLLLLCRAELNGLTKLLTEAGALTSDQIAKEFTEQYTWLADTKARQFGVTIIPGGLQFTKDSR